jgi:hypothetical protein
VNRLANRAAYDAGVAAGMAIIAQYPSHDPADRMPYLMGLATAAVGACAAIDIKHANPQLLHAIIDMAYSRRDGRA